MNTAGDCVSLDMTLARHCAPVLLGKKPAALFPMPRGWDETLAKAPPLGNMRFLSLQRPGQHALVFSYHPRLLSRTLDTAGMRETLGALGYPMVERGNTGPCLAFLEQRFREGAGFPHEVGFFLGYPPEDVLGFIRHQGSHCKLCGMWKVYGDAARAAVLFAEYAECRERLLRHVQNGGAIVREKPSTALAG
ncbi:MAG: DUF3793 family protein [Treponema sp.]|jgi:hypothetical protein|nr:DUF3793 family protein [Treponema sp.]